MPNVRCRLDEFDCRRQLRMIRTEFKGEIEFRQQFHAVNQLRHGVELRIGVMPRHAPHADNKPESCELFENRLGVRFFKRCRCRYRADHPICLGYVCEPLDLLDNIRFSGVAFHVYRPDDVKVPNRLAVIFCRVSFSQ